jgi:hypothetical protein
MRIIIEIEGVEGSLKTPIGVTAMTVPLASATPTSTPAASTAPAEAVAADARIGAQDAGAAPISALQSPGVPPIPGASTAPAEVVAADARIGAQDAGAAPISALQSPSMPPISGAPPHAGVLVGEARVSDLAAGAAPDIRTQARAPGENAAGQ